MAYRVYTIKVNLPISLFEVWRAQKERACFSLGNELSRQKITQTEAPHSFCARHTSKRLMVLCSLIFYRSTLALTDSSGELINRYDYDPFGNIFGIKERIPNPYKYIGQWGVRQISNFRGMYYMRARMYAAKHGRFLSVDPLGIGGKSSNVYNYANNNPIENTDPKGTAVGPVVAYSMLHGSVENTYIYIATAGGKVTVPGIIYAAGKGALSGAISTLPKPAQAVVNGVVGGVEYAVQQALSGQEIDYGELANKVLSEALNTYFPQTPDIFGEVPGEYRAIRL